MDFNSAAPAKSDPAEEGSDKNVFRLAAQSWLALQAAQVPPCPHNFELWYTYLEGSNPELTRRMDEVLQHGHRPVPEVLALIYEECINARPEPDIEGLETGAEAIESVTRDAVNDLAAGRRYLLHYGDMLSTANSQLTNEQTVGDLIRTISNLVHETTRTGELNRALESKLSAAANQVQRLRASLAASKHNATTDPLTGLHNRRSFDSRLRRAMARNNVDDVPICLLLADVDRFKQFNDVYGHKTGDLVLRLVSRILSENVKGRDTVARYGGEEFALLLTDADEYAGSRVAEQIRAALDGKRLINRGSGHQIQGVTLSIGVAELRPKERAASLIERADAALYQAKRSGRNQVCLSSSLH